MSISEELEKLSKLRADGQMSEEEFARAKARLLDGEAVPGTDPYTSPQANPDPGNLPVECPPQSRQWAMFLHLSQLGNFLIPFSGFVAPIVLWQMKKDEWPEIDRHGKMIVNWLISAFIYGVVCAVLTLVIIGIFGVFALMALSVIFPIIGGIKANNGEFWEYPLTIKFIK